jgi:hypothetical protein
MSDGSQSPDSGPIAGGGPPSPFWLTKTRHDLRGPLGEILGFTEILQEEASERGLHQLVPDFRSLQQAAARIFAELNHSLTTDTILWHPDCLRELETLIQSLSTRIIAEAERLSEKCDGLNTQSFGDDLLRIGGSARRLRELAPRLLQELSQAAESAPWPARNENPAIAERDAPESPGQLENPPGAPPASGSLLIVDDHEANRALLARRLRRQGYTVSLAENGRQALEKLRARPFDLVLLDVIMPEMGGYQVLAKIKEDPRPSPHPNHHDLRSG